MILSLIKDLKARFSINVQCTICDNSGENEDFGRACKQEEISNPVLHNKMILLKKLLPYSTGYVQCFIVENFLFLEKWLRG